MAGFVPKEKLGKKAQKELNRQRRKTWNFSPVTRTVDSKKLYNRKKKARDRDDYGPGSFLRSIPVRQTKRSPVLKTGEQILVIHPSYLSTH